MNPHEADAQPAGEGGDQETVEGPGRVVRVGRRRVVSGAASPEAFEPDPSPPETLDETRDRTARDDWLAGERPPHWG